MSAAVSIPVTDSRPFRLPATLRHGSTLAWRGIVKTVNSPEALLDVTLQPVIFLLLFVYVFGGAIPVSTPGGYVNFLMPGIIAQTAAFASFATAIALAQELKKGVIDRLR